jgi:hypothetical protein
MCPRWAMSRTGSLAGICLTAMMTASRSAQTLIWDKKICQRHHSADESKSVDGIGGSLQSRRATREKIVDRA